MLFLKRLSSFIPRLDQIHSLCYFVITSKSVRTNSSHSYRICAGKELDAKCQNVYAPTQRHVSL